MKDNKKTAIIARVNAAGSVTYLNKFNRFDPAFNVAKRHPAAWAAAYVEKRGGAAAGFYVYEV